MELIHSCQVKFQSASVPREEIIMKESDNEDRSRLVKILCSKPECIQEICDTIGAMGGKLINEIDSFHEDD